MPTEERKKISDFAQDLEEKVIELVGVALQNMNPSHILFRYGEWGNNLYLP